MISTDIYVFITFSGHDDAAERDRAPSAPVEPELRWVDDDALRALDHETLWTYVVTACDAYHRLYGTCRPRPTGQVYLYRITYSFESFIKLYVVI